MARYCAHHGYPLADHKYDRCELCRQDEARRGATASASAGGGGCVVAVMAVAAVSVAIREAGQRLRVAGDRVGLGRPLGGVASLAFAAASVVLCLVLWRRRHWRPAWLVLLVGVGLAWASYSAGRTAGSPAAAGAPPPAALTVMAIQGGRVHVRAGPGERHRVVAAVGPGARLAVGPADASGWAIAYDAAGVRPTGYVYRASPRLRPLQTP